MRTMRSSSHLLGLRLRGSADLPFGLGRLCVNGSENCLDRRMAFLLAYQIRYTDVR